MNFKYEKFWKLRSTENGPETFEQTNIFFPPKSLTNITSSLIIRNPSLQLPINKNICYVKITNLKKPLKFTTIFYQLITNQHPLIIN